MVLFKSSRTTKWFYGGKAEPVHAWPEYTVGIWQSRQGSFLLIGTDRSMCWPWPWHVISTRGSNALAELGVLWHHCQATFYMESSLCIYDLTTILYSILNIPEHSRQGDRIKSPIEKPFKALHFDTSSSSSSSSLPSSSSYHHPALPSRSSGQHIYYLTFPNKTFTGLLPSNITLITFGFQESWRW